MNLDELQIKISIELDDLNKQLKSITKGIDEALGPKATKKLMADNNKIIKSGLTAINKTTLNLVKKSRKDTTKEVEAMSKDINKSLNKAFDINLTKFNSNITSAMNQARTTVRSACNDIRRELNNALNIRGNIRVTGKASISGSATGSSDANVASTMASSQYIGAMIIKATNAVIKTNNANTRRLEQAINGLAGKLASAIRKINITTKTTPVSSNTVSPNNIAQIQTSKTSIKPKKKTQSREKDTLERNKAPLDIGIKEEIAKAKELLEKARESIKRGDEILNKSKEVSKQKENKYKDVDSLLKNARESDFLAKAKAYLNGTDIKKPGSSQSSNSLLEGGRVNFALGETGDLFVGTVERMRQAFNMVKSLGTSGINFDLGDTKDQIADVVELMKQIHSLRKGLASDTTSFTYGEVITPQVVDLPMTQFEKTKEIIEDATYRVLDFEKALKDTSNFDLVGEGLIDDSQVKALKQVHELMQKIKATPLGLNAPDGSNSQPDLSQLNDMMAKIKEIGEEFEDIKEEMQALGLNPRYLEETLSSLKDWIKPLEEALGRLNEIDKKRVELNIDTTDAKNQIEALRTLYETTIEALGKINNHNAIIDLFPDAQQPQAQNNRDGRKFPGKPVNGFGNGGSGTSNKGGKPSKPTIMGFGFGAYKNEIDKLIEYAKKAGAKIKKVLSDAWNPDVDSAKLDNVGKEVNKNSNNFINSFNNSSTEEVIRDVEYINNQVNKKLEEMGYNTRVQIGEIRNSFSGLTDDEVADTIFKQTIKDIRNLGKEADKTLQGLKNLSKQSFNAKKDFTKRDRPSREFTLEGYNNVPPTPMTLSMKEGSDSLFYSDKEEFKDDEAKLKNVVETLNDLEKMLKNLKLDIEIDKEDTKKLAKYSSEINVLLEVLNKLNERRTSINLDTSESKDKIKQLKKDYESLVNDLSNKKTGDGNNENTNKNTRKPPKPTTPEIDFGAYKNKIDTLIEYAKKAVSKFASNTRAKLSKAFAGIKIGKLGSNISNTLNKAKGAVSKFANKARQTLNKTFDNIKTGKLNTKISQGLNKAKSAVSKFSGKVRPTLNKAFDGIKSGKLYANVSNALNRARGAVSKFAGKVGSEIKGIFRGTGTNLFGDFGRSFDSHVAVQQVGELKEKLKASLDKIKANFKKTASEINKLANKLTAPFKKIASILNNVASSTKSAWSKITGIFKKGANDAVNATNKLSIGLKDLLKQALGFVSLYGLINLGKQAVTQSQELAQAEIKLTSLMKQRMGATNETVLAIRQLAEEQARLGVVSETAMKRGAEQLSYYVHSAKALKELMPAIANLTAKRGGFNATPDDAEEIATQLGEAIREGTTTPLEQSGIYLSEAEIKKFQALRTEEERAAFLAKKVAENVGDINEALANTPHGQITQLKNNFQSLLGTLGIFLANVIQPIVKWLNVIVVACNNALKALGKLLGFDMTGGTLEVGDLGTGSTEVDTGGVEDVTDSLEDTTDAAEEAEEAVEKFKGSLAGFDEINILTDNTDKNKEEDNPEDDPTNITPGEGGQLIPEVGDLTEGENIFDKFSDKMKAFIDEVLEPFKNAWALLGDDLKAEWADLQESFKNFCDKLAQFLKSVWENGGKEFVQHMAEIALAVAKAAMEIGGEILDSLARLWEHLDPKNNEHTQRFLDYLNDTAEKLRDFLLGLGDHFESLMANGGQDVLNALGDCFMDLGAAAVKGLGLVIDALDGLIDHLDPAVNENTRNMLQALADMFHAVGQTALDFVDLLESCLLNGGQDMINAFGDMMMNLGQATAEIITTIMESFSALFKYLDPATNDITKHMMKAWEEAFLAIGQAALGFSELFDSIMKNGGQEALNALADAFNSLIALAGTVTKEVAEAFDALFEHLDPKTNEFTKGMLEAWKNAFEGITELCQTLEATLGSFMDNGGQDLLNSLGDLAMQVSELLAVIVDEVAECMSEFFTHMDPGKNENSKGALEALKYFVDSIRDFVDMLGRSLDTFMENGGQEFVNNIGDIIAILVDLGATVAGDLINSITAFMDSWLGHAVISLCASALELITDVLKALLEILEPLSPIISAVVAAIGGFIVAQKVIGFITPIVEVFQALAGSGGLLALAKGAFTALWGVIAANPIAATVAAIAAIGVALVALYNKCEGFREFVDNILKGFVGFFEEFKQHFSTLLEDIKAIFQNVIDIIVGVFTGDGEKVGEAVRNLIGNIINLFLDLNKAFVEVGWELIKGLAQGIWECVKAIPDLLAGIGEFIIDFFKGLFGIHSPSTVFAEIGVNLIEGLIEGIESSITALGDAIAAVGEAIFGTVEDIVSFVSDKWKEFYDTTVEKWTDAKEFVVEKCSDIYNNTKEKYQSLKETVTDSLENVRKSSEEKWNAVKQKTSEIVSSVRQDIEEKYSKFKDMLSTHLENWRQSSEKIWSNIKNKTSELVSGIKSEAEENYSKLKEKIADSLDKFREHSDDTWSKVKDKTTDFVSKIKSDVEDKYENLKKALTDKLNTWKQSNEDTWKTIKETGLDTFDKLRNTGVDAFQTLKTSLSSNMDELKSKLTSTMEAIRTDLTSKWEDIKAKAIDAATKTKSDVERAYNELKTNLGSKLEEVRSEANTKWNAIKTATSTSVKAVVTEATNKFAEIKDSFTKKMDEVKNALTPKWNDLKNSVKTNAQGIGTKVTEGLSGLKQKFTKPFDEAKSSISSTITSIGNLLRNTSWSLPKIKLPHISVSGKFSLDPPSVPSFSIQWYKRGGIIDGLTPLGFANGSLHMGGEAGKEMVVPLENTSFTSKIAQAMGQAVDNAMARNARNMSGQVNNTNENKDVVLQIDGREFARASINSINKLQRESGKTLLDI